LPEVGLLQALAVDLRYASNSDGLVARRWLTCRLAWLRHSRRLVVGVWLPWYGERWLSIPLWQRHQDRCPGNPNVGNI
jgi:hypothetical protein